MSASVKQQARTAARTAKRLATIERKHQQRAAAAQLQEQRDEAIAPAAQRIAILDRDGEVIQGARVERSRIGFVRSNPIRRLVARGQNKEHPLLTQKHANAADRLLTAWTEAGEGITFGVANYDVKVGGASSVGMISDGVLHGINRQVAARAELEGVRTRLGARWGCLFSIVVAGIDVSAWGTAVGMSPAAAGGYLAACLDMVVDFYAGPAWRDRAMGTRAGADAGKPGPTAPVHGLERVTGRLPRAAGIRLAERLFPGDRHGREGGGGAPNESSFMPVPFD